MEDRDGGGRRRRAVLRARRGTLLLGEGELGCERRSDWLEQRTNRDAAVAMGAASAPVRHHRSPLRRNRTAATSRHPFVRSGVGSAGWGFPHGGRGSCRARWGSSDVGVVSSRPRRNSPHVGMISCSPQRTFPDRGRRRIEGCTSPPSRAGEPEQASFRALHAWGGAIEGSRRSLLRGGRRIESRWTHVAAMSTGCRRAPRDGLDAIPRPAERRGMTHEEVEILGLAAGPTRDGARSLVVCSVVRRSI